MAKSPWTKNKEVIVNLNVCNNTPMSSLLNRIAIDRDIVHGKPRIRGTRVTVQVILELLAAGESFEDLLSDYDELCEEDIKAALKYAASSFASEPVVIPFEPLLAAA